MIGRISGTVVHIEESSVIVDVSGIGYSITTTNSAISSLSLNKSCSFWTYLAVRDDALDLYGLPTQGEMSFFKLLISVPSIGPKSAINILNTGNLASLQKAIAAGDTAHLVKVQGIGKKSAAKIVLELKDKIGSIGGAGAEWQHNDVDALEALRSIGYSPTQARDALSQVPEDISGTENRVKEALKILGS